MKNTEYVVETAWPAKFKIRTICPFTEKVAGPWPRTMFGTYSAFKKYLWNDYSAERPHIVLAAPELTTVSEMWGVQIEVRTE